MAVIFAISFTMLITVVVGAVELQRVVSDKIRTQDAADAAALFGAKQLSVEPLGLVSRTEAFAQAQLGNLPSRADVTVKAAVVDPTHVQVTIDTHQMSFFGNILPPGGFFTHAAATAEMMNGTPLCVLIFGDANHDDLQLAASSITTAPACLVHSNQDIRVGGAAMLTAKAVEASGKAQGPISPQALTGAPTIADPFADVPIAAPNCPKGKLEPELVTGFQVLPAGPHCADVTVENAAVAVLAPGVHYFMGDLVVADTSRLTGEGVTLVFDTKSKFRFKDQADVNLSGSLSGSLAGFVVATTRSNGSTFSIESDHVSRMVGTIYIPAATLQVTATSRVAQASAWTVITARSLQLTGTPDLVINANYSASNVPVPQGVGPNIAGTRLVK